MPDDTVTLHGTTIAVAGRGILLIGPSGSGKSDLALRCLMVPAIGPNGLRFELVADDQTLVGRTGSRLIASPPAMIAGKLEVRGLGILNWPYAQFADLVAVADLTRTAEAIERFPDPVATTAILDLALPVIEIAPFEASAPLKLMLALDPGNGLVAP